MKINKILAVVMSFGIVFGTAPVYGKISPNYAITVSAEEIAEEEYTEITEGYLTFKVYSDYAEVSQCDESAEGEIIIPSEINGVPVKNIDINTWGFDSFPNLTSITIPESVTTINEPFMHFIHFIGLESINVSEKNEYYSDVDGVLFNKDKSLLIEYPAGKSDRTSYIIPDSVIELGHNAFYNCSSLESITIPDSVKSINAGGFMGCSNLKSITIPNGITEITYCSFAGCSSLTSINLPDSITSIGMNAFAGCSSLESITIPDSVIIIYESAFNGCSSLTSITIPDSVTEIDYGAFYDCSSLESINVSEKNEYYSDVDGVFFSKDKSTLITYPAGKSGTYAIPESVTKIYSGAFGDCSSLTSITIPDSVTEIWFSAFSGCSSLTSITIPESVTEIYSGAFGDCSSLESITILNPDCEITDDYGGATISNGHDEEEYVYYFNGTIYGYENSTAQTYAEEYNYNFVAIENDNPVQAVVGDANLDGGVSLADCVTVLQYIANQEKYPLTEQALANADAYNTGDGITAMDALAIQKYDSKAISELPLIEE